MKPWENKVVLISGGLGDIALATALAFGREGAKIALSDIRMPADANGKLELLQRENITFLYNQVDIAVAAAVSEWVNAVHLSWGRIDVAVVNAATVTMQSIADISAAAWQAEIQVNLNGAFFLAQQAAIYFSKHHIKGNIVFLGSWAAHAVHPYIPAYSVAKAGMRMLCKCMALEFAAQDIRVNEIAPGYVNAGLSKEVWDQRADLAETAKLKVPLQRLIEAYEVAAQILWICADANRHLTGSCLLMDGGLSLLRP
ncbi:2-deoxy-D-gluconate 3-dehydrogenase [Niastella koreensis]|uniref:Short-chain dehydrogenase/reductase SDR n=2 Tax=Niastella koreensis TaxID=354356 RepID=G8T743_NIAKG|nr:SDR family oxidoreductase [Niastella koreensis]AEW00068.1 short-chain dehydrogenase/reductase SDR [Niastella koreensis GR20-10]OQP49622.1 2-deoxy-D-gluconate 3-dehydrogenase [Niastella koreensis]